MEAVSGHRRRGAEFFRVAVEHGHDPLLLLHPDGHVVYASPEAMAMLGLAPDVNGPAEETVNLIERLHPDDREPFRQVLGRVAAHPGQADFLEGRMLRPSQRVRWVEIACRNFLDHPEVDGILVHVRDISTRRALEEALQRSRQTLEEVQSFTHFGIWSSGFGEPRMLEWSSEIYRIFGVPPERFDGKWETFLAMVHPDDRAVVREAVEVARRGDAPYQVEHRIVRPDGGSRWVQQQGEVVRSAAGAPLRLVGVVRDITETRRAEESRRESERRFRTLIENSEDGILLLNREGEVLYASPSAGRLVDRPAENLVNVSLFELVMGEDHDVLAATLAEVVGTGARSRRAELRVFVDKRVRILETVWSDHLHDRGLHALIVNARDVTSNRELAEQLQQAGKMEAVGRLAGGIAHDFNNQLTVILGVCTETLRGMSMSDPLREALGDIQEASHRASALTHQLLAFGRRQMLIPKVLDLNALVVNLEKMLRRLIGEDILLTTSLADDLGTVRADPGQIEQVIVNLVVNARDAMPKGGRVTITTENQLVESAELLTSAGLSAGPYVQLTIADTGVGMTPEVLARVFDPFFTTKGQGKGTGLGLSTVYGIIRQSGGHVTAESARGVGSTFRILLPRERRRALTPQSRPEVATLPRGHETVLVVEDEPAVRRLVSRLLTDLGYEVHEAAGASEALAVMERIGDAVHLLLSDVVMPGMSGPELGQELHVRFPALRFLYMSGYTDEAILQRGLQIQGSSFIGKPFTPEELAGKVREILAHNPSSARL